jgi:hypothetical protein
VLRDAFHVDGSVVIDPYGIVGSKLLSKRRRSEKCDHECEM